MNSKYSYWLLLEEEQNKEMFIPTHLRILLCLNTHMTLMPSLLFEHKQHLTYKNEHGVLVDSCYCISMHIYMEIEGICISIKYHLLSSAVSYRNIDLLKAIFIKREYFNLKQIENNQNRIKLNKEYIYP